MTSVNRIRFSEGLLHGYGLDNIYGYGIGEIISNAIFQIRAEVVAGAMAVAQSKVMSSLSLGIG